MAIQLDDEHAEVYPVPTGNAGSVREPDLEYLTGILREFNDLFGKIGWKDADNVRHQIARIPAMVSRDRKYQNAMRNADKQEARTESDRALQSVISSIMSDNMELYKQIVDNSALNKWLSDRVFSMTYNKDGRPLEGAGFM